MGFLYNILYIVIFIVFLSLLILIHELGHLLVAKAFKVRCFEFSIGMGPAIFTTKPKGKKTRFTIRAIPFGGYVSMQSKDTPAPDGSEIDENESVEVQKKYKRALIFSAGVVMNMVLAFVIFFVSSWMPKSQYYVNSVTAQNSSFIENGNYLFDIKEYANNVYAIDEQVQVVYTTGENRNDVVAAINFNNFSFKKTSLSNYLNFYIPYEITVENEDGTPGIQKAINADSVVNIGLVEHITFKMSFLDVEQSKLENKEVYGVYKTFTVHSSKDANQVYHYDDIGLTVDTISVSSKNLGEALGKSFKDIGNSATFVIRSLGTLVTTPSSWSQAGGIVAIGFETTSILQNLGFSYFLFMWGMISVNLAIMNIIPIPGLDGWHLLLLVYEAIARKPMNKKVQTIATLIGFILIFSLMIVLLFKDVFIYIFNMGVRLL